MERGGVGSLRLFYGRSAAAAKSVAESTSLLVLFHSTLIVFCFKYVQIRMRCDEIFLLIRGSDNLMLFLCCCSLLLVLVLLRFGARRSVDVFQDVLRYFAYIRGKKFSAYRQSRQSSVFLSWNRR
ncbi:unnamed protein product [Sphagnum troendelagicum]|uniref:Transmembrane protein n=1 Tax=Sphagnum jensenii TaxID=128206 RepID=A0ABP0WLF1_9BRYO